MTTTKKFLLNAFAVQTDEAQDVPGLAFTIPAGQSAHLKLQLLYDCPGDVDGVLSLNISPENLEYAAFVFDGSHQVETPADLEIRHSRRCAKLSFNLTERAARHRNAG